MRKCKKCNQEKSLTEFIKNKNVTYTTSLTCETGKEDGAITKLSKNEQVKYSLVGLSDEAIKELYACLHHYLKNVL